MKDNLYKAKTPPCQPDDCSISIKLSSTLFRSESQASDSEAAAAVDVADDFFFDKNGAVIPYPALKALLHSDEFKVYMEQVKRQFEQDSGSKAWPEDDDEEHGKVSETTPLSSRPPRQDEEDQVEEEEEDEEEEVPLKVKKTSGKKSEKKKWCRPQPTLF